MPDNIISPDWSSGSMSPEARDVYENTFLPQYRKLQESVSKTPLVILVWGPGPRGGDLYEKRLQIRSHLRKLGHAAVFSEEIELKQTFPDLSANARELLQAKAADFIVVIQGSPGSIAEVHDFAGFYRDIGSKMLIFIDEQFREGYSYTGILQCLKTLYYNNVETYEYPKDIKECFLLQSVQKKVQVLQFAKWRKENMEII